MDLKLLKMYILNFTAEPGLAMDM